MQEILIGLGVVVVVVGSLWALSSHIMKRENKYYEQDFTGPESDDMFEEDAFDAQYPEF